LSNLLIPVSDASEEAKETFLGAAKGDEDISQSAAISHWLSLMGKLMNIFIYLIEIPSCKMKKMHNLS